MKKNTRRLIMTLLSVLVLTMLLSMPASAASKKTVATIGKKSYTSMSSAVKAVKNGQTIELQKDTKIKSALNRNKKYTINLNGHTLTGTYSIKDTRISSSNAVRISAGSVTVKNGAVTGFYVNKGALLTVSNMKTDPNADLYNTIYCYIKKGAAVKFKSGSFNRLSIYNYGTLTINKMTVKDRFDLINESSGTATIKEGTFNANGYDSITNSGKLTISGGTFKDIEFRNSSGKMTISDGKFTSGGYNSQLGISGGQVIIKGGTFKSTSYDTVISNSGTLKITGGTIKSTSYDTVISNYGTLKITGGTIKSTGSAENLDHASMGTIFCRGGSKTTITGGTISNKYSNGIYIYEYADSFKCSGAKITVSSSKMKKIRDERSQSE